MTWLCVEQPSWFAHDCGDHVMLKSAGRFVGAVVTGANPIDLRVETYIDVDPDESWAVEPVLAAVAESVPSALVTVSQFDLFGARIG